jgi:hypothetical protein
LINLVETTRNQQILSGVFTFFGDRGKEGLEDRAIRAIEERDDEANETILTAADYLGKVKAGRGVRALMALLDSQERRFMAAAFRALGRAAARETTGEASARQEMGVENRAD